jgi:hypothetical protein
MTLQYEVETLEGLDESTAGLYQEKDGKYVLDVDLPTVKNDGIPRTRLNQEIEKRKATETTLAEIAETFVEEIPEDMRDLIPDLPPAAKIKWIKAAATKGLFNPKQPIDSRRPNDKPPEDLSSMSPQAKMARGYKTK